MPQPTTINEAANLRALRAAKRVYLYELAGRVKLNPTTLGAMLNERQPLPRDVAERIRHALEEPRV